MIDPVRGWLEITQYNNKRAISISNLVETMWLSRYPSTIWSRRTVLRVGYFQTPVEFVPGLREKKLGKQNWWSITETSYAATNFQPIHLRNFPQCSKINNLRSHWSV